MSDIGVVGVIEDDTDMRNLLEGVLLQAGFVVHTAAGGREGVEMVRATSPDIATLDVGLPDIDGVEVLRPIRQFSDVYVVMLTGKSEEADLLNALHTGADDYITKPFRPREVRARITTMMRRLRTHAQDTAAPASAETLPPENGESVLTHNGLRLDGKRRTVSVDGMQLELTRSEFDLLPELLRGRNQNINQTLAFGSVAPSKPSPPGARNFTWSRTAMAMSSRNSACCSPVSLNFKQVRTSSGPVRSPSGIPVQCSLSGSRSLLHGRPAACLICAQPSRLKQTDGPGGGGTALRVSGLSWQQFRAWELLSAEHGCRSASSRPAGPWWFRIFCRQRYVPC